ncbi:glyoxalase superfamily protein [uncultured Roseovarius sp.]|uniref:glyoxalase superfamily protein n=1 Tax=uncultured Roseovarius sp. TaxID=293344 RepID=UPI00262EA969|nr:glyoxalase superfamily protein [uncultured Roseovarius sp.]
MTLQNLPTRDALKAQAKRLRATLGDQGTPVTHAAALETIARQWGFRDWNTLSATAGTGPTWQVGQTVTGHYLGHAFTARLKSVREAAGGHWHLTLVFDQPIDVVTSDRFSALRRQVRATVNARGVTHQKTSDGQPHLVLDLT